MEFEHSYAYLTSCPFAITSLICCQITILYKPMAKSMKKGKFRPSQLRNRLIDCDEIRSLQNYLLKITHHAKFHFDPTMWVVSANTQFATVTEKVISGVHVFPGSAETLFMRGGITNHHSIAQSLSNITENYQNMLMCVEVIDTQCRSFRRRSSQPISWHSTEETKSNTKRVRIHK